MMITLACSKKLTGGVNVVIVRMPVTGRHEDAVPEACFVIKPRAVNLSGYAASIKLLRYRENYGEHY